ncbi:MAG: RNA pyrophosphohydrolase [Sphingomonadales bacterium]
MTPGPTAYRPNVGVILVNRDGLVFVAARLDNPADAWQMPQGGIDKGEDPRVAAVRELEEEIGTDKVEIVAESEGWYEYDLPAELIGRMWGGKYRGQKQKWFVLRFTGEDGDIELETKHPEFRDWKWVPFETVPDLIVPFKRDLYRELVETFGDVVRSIGSRISKPVA